MQASQTCRIVPDLFILRALFEHVPAREALRGFLFPAPYQKRTTRVFLQDVIRSQSISAGSKAQRTFRRFRQLIVIV